MKICTTEIDKPAQSVVNSPQLENPLVSAPLKLTNQHNL